MSVKEKEARLAAIKTEMALLEKHADPEEAHVKADELVTEALKLLGHQDVAESYCRVPRWYA